MVWWLLRQVIAVTCGATCAAAAVPVLNGQTLRPPQQDAACPSHSEKPADAARGQAALLQQALQIGALQVRQVPELGADDDDLDAHEDTFRGGRFGTAPMADGPARISSAAANRSGALAPKVWLGLYLNNIDQVNSRTNQITGDVILKSMYRKQDFGAKRPSVEIVNGKVDFRNEVRLWEEKGNMLQTEHLYVTLHFDGVYDQFPFDVQTIGVSVQIKGLTAEEATFEAWMNFTGIRPYDETTGKRFQTAQYYVKSWEAFSATHHEYGMPYNKSRGELRLTVGRALPYYVLTCSLIPSMAILFAIFAFCLPITLIVPRVTISFTSFLAMFVHVKQMTTMVPDGVWCWLMTDLLFFCTILAAAITSNMLSAKLFHSKETWLSDVHDAFVRWVLPGEFCVGQALIYFGRLWHQAIGAGCVLGVLAFHILILARFHIKLHEKSKQKEDLFCQGAFLVLPCFFSHVIDEDGTGSAVPFKRFCCPWFLTSAPAAEAKATSSSSGEDRLRQCPMALKKTHGGGEEGNAAMESGENVDHGAGDGDAGGGADVGGGDGGGDA